MHLSIAIRKRYPGFLVIVSNAFHYPGLVHVVTIFRLHSASVRL